MFEISYCPPTHVSHWFWLDHSSDGLRDGVQYRDHHRARSTTSRGTDQRTHCGVECLPGASLLALRNRHLPGALGYLFCILLRACYFLPRVPDEPALTRIHLNVSDDDFRKRRHPRLSLDLAHTLDDPQRGGRSRKIDPGPGRRPMVWCFQHADSLCGLRRHPPARLDRHLQLRRIHRLRRHLRNLRQRRADPVSLDVIQSHHRSDQNGCASRDGLHHRQHRMPDGAADRRSADRPKRW